MCIQKHEDASVYEVPLPALTCLVLTATQEGPHFYFRFMDKLVRLRDCPKVTQQLSFEVRAPTQVSLLLLDFSR